MIYTIGYQRLTVAALKQIVENNNMILIDVRARPYGRKHEFNRSKLEAELGPLYQWHGDTLGGKGQKINQKGIEAVRAIKNKHPLLMCIEEAPGDCHRHHTICFPFFPRAIHIYGDELITADHLQTVIDDKIVDYEIVGTLTDSKVILD